MVGETVGHYRVLTLLGSGGMGIVYQAEDVKLGRPVALKFLAESLGDDPSIHERFLREARAAATLNHPNICTIYEINDAGPRPFIAMELLEGETLQQRLVAGPMPLDTLLDLAIQVADALEAAHGRGLIHRDIKPGNIFVTADGRAKVVDFGLAKTIGVVHEANQNLIQTGMSDDQVVTRTGTTMGTVAYMSPEQARGEQTDARSDVFSFGVVLYEMATGRRAFDGATTAVVFDGILNRMPLPPSFVNPTVPPDLERVIGRAIEKRADARYPRMAEVASQLRRLRRTSDPEVRAVAGGRGESSPASPGWGTAVPGEASGAAVSMTGAGRRPRRRRTVFALSAVLAVVVALGGMLAWWFSRSRVVAEGAPILVADFENTTGDADFDATLKQALTIDLEESPYLTVVSPQKVREALALMARKPDDPLTPALGREMCQRIGGGALMTGQIARFGKAYLITVAAESCETGDEIARDQAQADKKEDVLRALGTVLSSMRGRLGESLTSIRAHDKSLVEATTSSLPALKTFSLGDRRRAAGADLEAIPYYKEAVDRDPQFALAWARLGTVYGNIGEDDLSKQCYQKAYDLRDRASEHERFYITSHYYRTVAGDLQKAREVFELWRQQYPHDFVPVHNAGVVYEEMGEPERALQAFRDAGAMEPRNRLAREALAETLMALGRRDEARRAAERELADLGDSPQPHLVLYQLDYLAGDRAGMAQHARKIAGTAFDLELRAIDLKIALYEGRFRAASGILAEGRQQAESQGRVQVAQGAAAMYVMDRAMVGFTADTRSDVTRLLAGKSADDTVVACAFALLFAGDVTRARALAAPIWAREEKMPVTVRVVRPAFEALGELRVGRPARAIDALQASVPWEDKFKSGASSASVRGHAYLALGDGKAAEAQFQKVVRAGGPDIAAALAQLGVGRARALAGDRAGARGAYDEFFSLWANADPDVPILRQARAEYAKLGA